jgi:hypothetical protein
MLGWILTFGLMAMFGICYMLAGAGGSAELFIKFEIIVSTGLFCACVLTRIARRRV